MPRNAPPGQGRSGVGDVGAGGPPLGDDAVHFQLTVGPGHGVGVDDEPVGEDADGGQLLARLEAAGGDQVLDLVDDLLVNRQLVGR